MLKGFLNKDEMLTPRRNKKNTHKKKKPQKLRVDSNMVLKQFPIEHRTK